MKSLFTLLLILVCSLGVCHVVYGQKTESTNNFDQINKLWVEQADKFLNNKDITEAIKALKKAEEHPSSDQLNIAKKLDNLSKLYDSYLLYHKSAPLYKRALEIREKSLKYGNPDTINNINNLAKAYLFTGQPDQAELLFDRSLEIVEKTYGPKSREIIKNINDRYAVGIVNNMVNLENLTEVIVKKQESLLKRAVSIRDKKHDRDYPEVVESLNNLGLMYSFFHEAEFFKNESPEPYLTRGLEINEKIYGKNNLKVAECLSVMIMSYFIVNKDDLTIDPPDTVKLKHIITLCERVVAIDEKNLRKSKNAYYNDLLNLSEFYIIDGKYNQAEKLLTQILAQLETNPDMKKPTKTDVYFYQSTIYRKTNRDKEADELDKKIADIKEKESVKETSPKGELK